MSSESRLPDSYDELVEHERLQHGEHNVRFASPSEQLKRSIEKDGIQSPLVVRPVEGDDAYQVTDGWQRYQAALELGWDELPVKIYENTLQALEAAETQSIVREWTTYQAARHVNSLYSELREEFSSKSEAVEIVAERTARSKPTVRRYLNALQLPEVLHPLLKKRQNITDAEWEAIKNHKDDIRNFDGLSWQVAAEAGQHAAEVDDERLIRIVLATLGYDSNEGERLVQEAIEDPDASMSMLKYRLFDGGSEHHNWIRVPQTGIRLENDKKEAIMDYCHERKVHLSDVVEEQMKNFAENVQRSERKIDEFN
jgi:ParB/RepB/Spo0J family partition protein